MITDALLLVVVVPRTTIVQIWVVLGHEIAIGSLQLIGIKPISSKNARQREITHSITFLIAVVLAPRRKAVKLAADEENDAQDLVYQTIFHDQVNVRTVLTKARVDES